MTDMVKLWKLHIKKQMHQYLFPITFLYLFLLPYHMQLLTDMDEAGMVQVFDSAQKYLLLFEIWFQYLGFRMVLSPELKEASYSCVKKIKGRWMLGNLCFSFLCFLPYALWMFFHCGTYYGNLLPVLVQCIIAAGMMYTVMYFLQSATGGMAVMVFYFFCCASRVVPEPFRILRLGILPLSCFPHWCMMLVISIIVSFFVSLRILFM